MIAGRIRKAGNSYVVTIPPTEMKARWLREGQLIGFDPVPHTAHAASPSGVRYHAHMRCSTLLPPSGVNVSQVH